MKEALIKVNSIQAYETEEEDSVEFSTDGVYDFVDGSGVIVYFESEVTGLTGTKTKIIFSHDEVVVDREGTVTSRMIFKEGSRSSFVYETPYGNATMNVTTRRIVRYFDENGGAMDLEYIVDVEHMVVTRNKFTVRVTEIV